MTKELPKAGELNVRLRFASKVSAVTALKALPNTAEQLNVRRAGVDSESASMG
ncbi:MAG TPA: hypothetical protein VJT50_13500 [Pyrinomonadaceae bacterium]|nr:hypothetical protein [Pyrinomonadaceae bacterium]